MLRFCLYFNWAQMYQINCRSHRFCPSWTTFQEHFRSAGKTDCGEICPRCRVALASKSSAFFLGRLFFLRISNCSVRPGRTAARGRSGSSNLYVIVYSAHFWKRFWKSFASHRKHGKITNEMEWLHIYHLQLKPDSVGYNNTGPFLISLFSNSPHLPEE